MKLRSFAGGKHASERPLVAALLAFALLAGLASAARGDSKTDARNQFERAVKMRTTLEGYLEKDRSLDDYRRTVVAYRTVYLITPDTEEAAPALVAEAELYEEMGRLFDRKYFQMAIDRYDFLLKQYPGSRYRSASLFAIGKIQMDDLKKPDDAEASFQEFAKKYPRSDKIQDAQQALKAIGDQRVAQTPAQPQPQAQPPAAPPSRAAVQAPTAAPQNVSTPISSPGPVLQGQAVEPRVSDRRVSSVTEVHTWNGEESTRIIVNLNDTIKYDAVRIPDRIYFDLYKAKLGPRLSGKTMEVQNGLLKTVRVAQNKPDVVRLVLDVNGTRNYTSFLLSNPYRLVIDVHQRAFPGAPSNAAAAGAAALAPELKPTPAVATQPVEKVPAKTIAPPAKVNADPAPASVASATAPTSPSKPSLKTEVTVPAPAPLPKLTTKVTASLRPPPEAKPTRDGQRSLTRALGLKISRIVIDPGHGGHDTGTIGPHGLMEKDLCLDVALRLGSLIEQKLPAAEVIYTRKDDTFIPLEERTAIANRAKADLFVSIHANSSHDDAARGIETYYLNFATSAESMAVATRENALAQESLHDLQDLIKKIASNEKIEESKELATDVQDSLTQRLQLVSRSEKNRGVKKAPFVVLIGADMPSVLSEISFVSNPNDERLLRKTDQRQRIADGLYRGIASYLGSLNSLSNNKQKLVSDNPVDVGTVASNGNPK